MKNVYSKFSKNDPPNPVHGDQPVTAVSQLAASHHWSASSSRHRTWWNIVLLQRSVTVSNTVDTELIAYFADCKNYSENTRLYRFCVTNANHSCLHLPRTCC